MPVCYTASISIQDLEPNVLKYSCKFKIRVFINTLLIHNVCHMKYNKVLKAGTASFPCIEGNDGSFVDYSNYSSGLYVTVVCHAFISVFSVLHFNRTINNTFILRKVVYWFIFTNTVSMSSFKIKYAMIYLVNKLCVYVNIIWQCIRVFEHDILFWVEPLYPCQLLKRINQNINTIIHWHPVTYMITWLRWMTLS